MPSSLLVCYHAIPYHLHHQQGPGGRQPAAQPRARLTLLDGTVHEDQLGWEDVQGLPEGAVVQLATIR
jgi:hypothetical protein